MNKIYITADIHGSFKPIRNFLRTRCNRENDAIIILGDAGLNFFFNYRDEELKKKLNSYKITYFIIRGNHEERPSICMEKYPNEWHIEEFWENQVYVENAYPYIKYALDIPTKYEIPNPQGEVIKTLVLPGAYSVDKYYRIKNGWSWFPQEQCNEEEMAAGAALAQSDSWDLILSHTCPVIYEPTDLFLSFVDQSTVDKTTEQWLGQIEYNLNYKLWTFGHYHKLRVYPKYQNKQMLMLFNNSFLDIYKYFNSNKENIYESIISI